MTHYPEALHLRGSLSRSTWCSPEGQLTAERTAA